MTRILDHEIGELYRQHLATLAQRYIQALDHCDAERALVFAGNPQTRDRDDLEYPFRADPYFTQWVPLPDAAGSIIEFRPGHKPRLVFFAIEDFWHAPTPPPPRIVFDEFDVVIATSSRTGDYLSQRGEKTIAVGQASFDIGENLNAEIFLRHLDFDRAVKTEYEIECMRRANTIAVAGHRAVELTLHQEVSEFELHMQYCLASQQCDDDLPYPSIVGLNEHAAVLHYQHRDTSPPEEVRSLLIDAGAQVNGYASDITRTYSYSPGRFTDLIDATDEMQQNVCSLVNPGTDYVALNERCHLLLSQILVEFGFVTCTADAAYENGATGVFLPHGLGHLIGLQVHDVGGHSSDHSGGNRPPPDRHPWLRLTRALEPDMVVTIEPGIYFISSLLDDFERQNPGILQRDAIDVFAPYGGIRIEDNVRVKSDGHENLTRDAFRE